MLITVLCSVSLLGSARAMQDPQVVPMTPKVLGTVTETVPDPAHAGQTVDAQVKYTLSGKWEVGPSIGLNGPVLHEVQSRPGIKAPNLRVERTFDANPMSTDEAWSGILGRMPRVDLRIRGNVGDALAESAKAMADVLLGVDEIDPDDEAPPDGWTVSGYALDGYRISAQYELHREISLNHMSPHVETIKLAPVEWGMLQRVSPEPTSVRFVPDPKPGDKITPEQIEVLRHWGGGTITNSMGGLEGVGYLPVKQWDFPVTASVSLPQYGRDALAGILNITGKPIVSAELLGSINAQSVETLAGTASFGGDDMNSLQYRFEPNAFPNCTGVGDSYFPPGTMWVPDKPGYQTMSNYMPVNLRMDFNPFATIDPAAYVDGEFRTHCMNMELKEPAPGVRYFPYRNADPVVAGLMNLTRRSNVRGPWDQARMWIYTNKANLAEINKRLFPEISEAQFLTSLKQVSQLGGLAKKDYADKKLFVPQLLAGRGMALNTASWGFGVLNAHQPKELGAWLAALPTEMGKLVSGDAADKKHAATLCQLALSSGSPEVRLGALQGLLKKPAESKALAGQLGSLRPSLMSKSASEVEAALDVLAAYGGTGPKDALDVLVADGANAKIKQKAAALKGG